MGDLSAPTLLVLALLGLAGGVGITALGPGGVLPTIGLFALSGLPPSTIAGTAIVTHIGTGVLGSMIYSRSGQLREPMTRRTAATLCGSAVIGTPIGVLVNHAVPGRMFGILLGFFVALVAVLVWWRERRLVARVIGPTPHHSRLLLATLGLVIAAASGLFGIGGPMLTVPTLLACGIPLLSSIAAAQVQSVVIASVGTIGYLAQDSISWPLALLIGLPELCGVLMGWRLAHAVPIHRLKCILVAALLAIAPYLAWHG